MYNKIIESLGSLSDETLLLDDELYNKQRKSNSFTQLSDWNSKNRQKFNKSIILPKIHEERESKELRKVQSSLNNYLVKNKLKRYNALEIERQINKKQHRISLNDYFLNRQQQQIPRQHELLKSDHEVTKQSIINKVMNRKNRLKKRELQQQCRKMSKFYYHNQ